MASMGDDDLKRSILARRAKFVAATLATAGLGAACASEPQVCLSIVAPDDASTDGAKDGTTDAPVDGPQACLSPLPPDSGADGDAGADGAGDSGAG
jgi:hypothetical protein